MEKYLPVFNKYFNRGVVLMWKLGMGKLINCCPSLFGHTMVISAQGGAQTPVNYYSKGEYLYCTSAFGLDPDWYLGLIANPQVEVWLPDGWYTGKAELVSDPGEHTEMLREVLMANGLAAQLFAGLSPREMDEEQFAQAAEEYRLVRISRQSPRTGADGPGSLAWLWPLITCVLLLRRRRRK